MPKKPFTVWLVLLMIFLGGTLFQAGGALAQLDKIYQPLTANYPSLSRAMLAFQFLAVRETLNKAKVSNFKDC